MFFNMLYRGDWRVILRAKWSDHDGSIIIVLDVMSDFMIFIYGVGALNVVSRALVVVSQELLVRGISCDGFVRKIADLSDLDVVGTEIIITVNMSFCVSFAVEGNGSLIIDDIRLIVKDFTFLAVRLRAPAIVIIWVNCC